MEVIFVINFSIVKISKRDHIKKAHEPSLIIRMYKLLATNTLSSNELKVKFSREKVKKLFFSWTPPNIIAIPPNYSVILFIHSAIKLLNIYQVLIYVNAIPKF